MTHEFTDEQIEAVMNEAGLKPWGAWTPDEAALVRLILQARAERDASKLQCQLMVSSELGLEKSLDQTLAERDAALARVKERDARDAVRLERIAALEAELAKWENQLICGDLVTGEKYAALKAERDDALAREGEMFAQAHDYMLRLNDALARVRELETKLADNAEEFRNSALFADDEAKRRAALEAENAELRKAMEGVLVEHDAHLERLLLLEKEPIRCLDFQCHNCRTIGPVFGSSRLCSPCWNNALPKCKVCEAPARNDFFGVFFCDMHVDRQQERNRVAENERLRVAFEQYAKCTHTPSCCGLADLRDAMSAKPDYGLDDDPLAL